MAETLAVLMSARTTKNLQSSHKLSPFSTATSALRGRKHRGFNYMKIIQVRSRPWCIAGQETGESLQRDPEGAGAGKKEKKKEKKE